MVEWGASGKSTIFDAIIKNFTARKEEYRFLVLCPAGSIAALLNGSTVVRGSEVAEVWSCLTRASEDSHRKIDPHRVLYLVSASYRYLASHLAVHSTTYHSVFQIPREGRSKNRDDVDGVPNDAASIAAINERLQGVEYILLDEISMVSCEGLQTLASQAAKARNIHDAEFGNLNVH